MQFTAFFIFQIVWIGDIYTIADWSDTHSPTFGKGVGWPVEATVPKKVPDLLGLPRVSVREYGILLTECSPRAERFSIVCYRTWKQGFALLGGEIPLPV